MAVSLGRLNLSVDEYALLCLVPGAGVSALGTWRSWRYLQDLQKDLTRGAHE
jgi:hypothetical protein